LTLWNAAFRKELFYDGRSPTLEAQALQPMMHANEMNQRAMDGAKRVAAVAGYRMLFAAAFPDDSEPVTGANITRALSAFERTFITKHAPYDQYVAGDARAMSAEEKRGMDLFGASGCAGCHVPPLFESTRYDKRIPSDDPGRFAITNDPKDRGAFRVTTLRNLRDTAPYFHDGSVVSLEDAVRAELDREVAAGRAKPLSNVAFSDLVAFLYSSLEDISKDPTRPQSVPSGLQVPIDGDRIDR
jgi:cytochrome c peroxidase